MKEILEYLKGAEGETVHRNSNEKDITSPYGIYKYEHPEAKVFKYLDIIALNCGIVGNSKNWNASDIKAINSKMDPKRVEELVTQFYGDFLKGAHIELFPKECKIAMFSMYVNAPLHAWEAVQAAINSFVKSKHINYKIQGVDGSFGDDTKNGLIQIKLLADVNEWVGFLFEASMLLHMGAIYTVLVAQNPEKYMRYSKGWDNRLIKLLDLR